MANGKPKVDVTKPADEITIEDIKKFTALLDYYEGQERKLTAQLTNLKTQNQQLAASLAEYQEKERGYLAKQSALTTRVRELAGGLERAVTAEAKRKEENKGLRLELTEILEQKKSLEQELQTATHELTSLRDERNDLHTRLAEGRLSIPYAAYKRTIDSMKRIAEEVWGIKKPELNNHLVQGITTLYSQIEPFKTEMEQLQNIVPASKEVYRILRKYYQHIGSLEISCKDAIKSKIKGIMIGREPSSFILGAISAYANVVDASDKITEAEVRILYREYVAKFVGYLKDSMDRGQQPGKDNQKSIADDLRALLEPFSFPAQGGFYVLQLEPNERTTVNTYIKKNSITIK